MTKDELAEEIRECADALFDDLYNEAFDDLYRKTQLDKLITYLDKLADIVDETEFF